MPSNASITVVNRLSAGPITHLRLTGFIDETFDPNIVFVDAVGEVLLDVGRVERISSFGVRKWIQLVRDLPKNVTALFIVNAPPLFVDQLNMVEGFAGQSVLLSLLAPYTCPRCQEDRVRLVDVLAEGEVIRSQTAPAHKCPVCGTALQFADMPTEFFDFVAHQRLPRVDDRIRRYLASLRPRKPDELSDGGQQVKLVADDLTYFRLPSQLSSDLNVRRLSSGLEGRVVYDFASVSTIEPGAAEKLGRLFSSENSEATLVLWRVTPPVLEALAALGKPLSAGLATLYLPCDCRQCGTRNVQRVWADEYLAQLESQALAEMPCTICSGRSRLPSLVEIREFLSSANLLRVNPDEIEALEPRALSRYLANTPDVTGKFERPTPAPDDPGDRGSRLQLIRLVGRGGMAEVFLAKQVGLKGFEKYIVVKRILEQYANNPRFVEMLFAEARANARLTHPNIVQTYDVGLIRGSPFIAMEYVRGPDAKRALVLLKKAQIRLSPALGLRIAAEIARGLHFAHTYVDPTGQAQPVIHRDVSAHNILISLDGAIKLSDFGIAKASDEIDQTSPGTVKGKVTHLSPEAIQGQVVDARSDVFALGVTLFELLSGELPFKGENEASTLQLIMRRPTPNLSLLNPAVPNAVARLVERTLAKDPDQRVASAGELADLLEEVMASQRLAATPDQVARFLVENLESQLAEYAAGSQSGAFSMSQVAAAAAARPTAGEATPPTGVPATARDASVIELEVDDIVSDDPDDKTDPGVTPWNQE